MFFIVIHQLKTPEKERDLCIATFMSNVSIVPVSTWNMYNILDHYNSIQEPDMAQFKVKYTYSSQITSVFFNDFFTEFTETTTVLKIVMV